MLVLTGATRTSFNSTMVRLKGINQYWVRVYVEEFQFHNGSIKSKPVISGLTSQIAFQFHNGSIKSDYKDSQFVADMLFQFHNGSIKRRMHVQMPLHELTCFNSTMVRLKAIEILATDEVVTRFQFHNGSIKSR